MQLYRLASHDVDLLLERHTPRLPDLNRIVARAHRHGLQILNGSRKVAVDENFSIFDFGIDFYLASVGNAEGRPVGIHPIVGTVPAIWRETRPNKYSHSAAGENGHGKYRHEGDTNNK